MPNAGLPVLGADGAHYPLTPDELADAHDVFTREYGLSLVGGCCGTTPEHLRQLVDRVRGREVAPRRPRPEPGVASLYQSVPFRQDTVVPVDRRAHQRQRLQGVPRRDARASSGTTASRSPATRSATARTCSTCASTTSAATASPTCARWPGRFATASTLPLVLDSTELPGDRGRAGDARRPRGRQLGQLRGRRRADVADRAGIMPIDPRARRRRRRADDRRAGPGPHGRTGRSPSPTG